MNAFDADQLRTFTAIAETGSFTRAAERVHKTQSAVSMQMKRLEEAVGRPLFARQGRRNTLTRDGEMLLDYAIRLVRLNEEAARAFTAPDLSGHVRFGTPDDYADRFLPPILARYSRSHPKVDLTVICLPSIDLIRMIEKRELDLAIVSHVEREPVAEIIRREPLLWVTSRRHCIHTAETIPLAVGPSTCAWRRAAEVALTTADLDYRVVFTSWNAAAIAAAVLSGLAISVLPESAIRPGMDVIGPADGFPALPPCAIALVKGASAGTEPAMALAAHVVDLLDNFAQHSVGRSSHQIDQIEAT